MVVFTDGNDNASRMTPAEVSSIASAIDVPVYIVGVVVVDRQSFVGTLDRAGDKSPLAGPLVDLANWTGGHVFVSSTPVERSLAARQIVEELRHQYLIAFESSGDPGWHQLAVRRSQQQEDGRSCTKWLHRGALSPEFVVGGASVMRTLFKAIPVALIVVTGTTACASKKFVRTSVGEVNDKVDSLGRSVEETQERTRKNEGRITEVDQKAQAAATSAQQANGAAADAKNAAVDARSRRQHGRHQARHVRQAEPPARLRSGAERRSGQLQVRQGGSA